MNLDRMIAVRSDKTIYRDGDKCLKVFVGGRNVSDIFREAMNQSLLLEAGVCVPRVFGVRQEGEKWAIVFSYIRGKSLERHMEEEPERQADYLSLFIRLQKELHTMASPRMIRLADVLPGVLGQEELSPAVRERLRAVAATLPPQSAICHGDFRPSNILLSVEGKPYIIDCPLLFSGPPALDVAITYHRLRLADVDYADRYVKLYCGQNEWLSLCVRRLLPLAAAFVMQKSNARERAVLLAALEKDIE